MEKAHNEEPHSLYRSSNIVWVIKSRRLSWAGHVARMEEGSNAFKILTGKPTGKIITKKYHVFAPMGRFQLETIYIYFPSSSQLLYLCFCPVGLSSL